MVGDFHKMDRFGELVFVDEKGEVAAPAAAEPAKKADGKAEKADKADKKAEKADKKAEKAEKKAEKKAE
jgi:hypothetical protein